MSSFLYHKKLLAECNGECQRDFRPLSCRIFPLTPYITDNDILTIKIDPRARSVYPLATYSDRRRLNQDFVKNVRRVFQALIKDDEIKEFIVKLSGILDDYSDLRSTFDKNSR